MGGYTPGPWHVGWNESETLSVLADKRVIAFPAFSDRNPYHEAVTERDANARLISAAPDLLEALRLARDHTLESDRARNMPGWERVRNVVEAAIAKAEGRG